MLRKPESDYERRRSPTLLKVKPFDDAAAAVIAHRPATGTGSVPTPPASFFSSSPFPGLR
jgi:ATP-dependent DNA ligase